MGHAKSQGETPNGQQEKYHIFPYQGEQELAVTSHQLPNVLEHSMPRAKPFFLPLKETDLLQLKKLQVTAGHLIDLTTPASESFAEHMRFKG